MKQTAPSISLPGVRATTPKFSKVPATGAVFAMVAQEIRDGSSCYAGIFCQVANTRIVSRLERLEGGLFGDVKFFDAIGELRIDYGPGYRVYFIKLEKTIIVLLCGGNKKTQKRDITHAKQLAKELKT